MNDDKLQPARLEDEESSSYAPRFPLKILVPLALLLVGGITAYVVRENAKTDALRAELLARYDAELKGPAARALAFRERIEGFVREAAEQEPPETFAEPEFALSSLESADGLYLRIHEKNAADSEAIRGAAIAMSPDAITKCLGLSPLSLRGLYTHGAFLEPEFRDRIADADGMMRLRVVEDELSRHVTRDLSLVSSLMESRYFLLVIERGDNRRDAPVDVFLWDIPENRLRFRTRAEAAGLLLPVRIAMEGATRTARRPAIDSGGATDCSIAAKVKEALGLAPADVDGNIEEALAPPPAATPEPAGTP